MLICILQSYSQNSTFFKEASKHFKNEYFKADGKGWIKFKDDSKLGKGQAFAKYKANKMSNDEFKEISTKKDKKGNEHVRYQQYYKGILVECGTLIEHFRTGNLKIINGVYLEDIKTEIIPKITKSNAIDIAIKDQGMNKKYIWQDSIAEFDLKQDSENELASYFPNPELVIDCNKNLVYRFTITTDEDNIEYKINAISGKLESKVSKVLNCGHNYGSKSDNLGEVKQNIKIFGKTLPYRILNDNLNNSESIMSDLTTYGHTLFSGLQPIRTTWSASCWLCSSKHRLIANNYSSKIETRDHQFTTDLSDWRREVTMSGINNTTWPSSEMLHTQTHWAVTKSWDYFNNVHGMSVGAGNGTIRVKSNVNLNNARYLGDHRSLVFGFLNGNYLGTMDVGGHEFTHLMIHEANGLGTQTLNAEPNSLNESFADILGTMVERQYRPGGWDWIMYGEFSPIRNLLNPSLSPIAQPEVYLGPNWTFAFGPHINGGVQNKWFTLLALGGTHNGITVQGIGIDNAANIVMQNLRMYIQPLSNYPDASNGAVESAIDLFGECSFIHQQTEQAWLACGLGAITNCFGGGGNYKIQGKNDIFDHLSIFPNPTNNIITL